MTEQNTNDPSDKDKQSRPKLSLRKPGAQGGSTSSSNEGPKETQPLRTSNPPIRMEFKKKSVPESKETEENQEEISPSRSIQLKKSPESAPPPKEILKNDKEKDQSLNEDAFSSLQGRDSGGTSSHIPPSSLSFLKKKKTALQNDSDQKKKEEEETHDDSLPFVPQVKIPTAKKLTQPPIPPKKKEEAPPAEEPPAEPTEKEQTTPTTPEANISPSFSPPDMSDIDDSLVEPPVDDITLEKPAEPSAGKDRRPPPLIKPPPSSSGETNEQETDKGEKAKDKGLTRIPFRPKKESTPVKGIDDLDPDLAGFVEPPAGGNAPPPKPKLQTGKKEKSPSSEPPPPVLQAPPPPGSGKPPQTLKAPPPGATGSSSTKPPILAAPPPVTSGKLGEEAAAVAKEKPAKEKNSIQRPSFFGSILIFIVLFLFLAGGVYLIYRGATYQAEPPPATVSPSSRVAPPQPVTPSGGPSAPIRQAEQVAAQTSQRTERTNSIIGEWQTPATTTPPSTVVPAPQQAVPTVSGTQPQPPTPTQQQETTTANTTASPSAQEGGPLFPRQEISDIVDSFVINGTVARADSPRVIISSQIYQRGERVRETPAIYFIGVDATAKEVIFRDDRGAEYRKPY